MAPNGKVVEADGIKEKSGAALDLMAIKRAIPDECFVKSPLKATVYMLFDYGMIAASFYSMWTLSHSPQWATMPAWQQWVATGVYWNIAGFFMWCIFVVGHDCGHGTFSDSELLNDIVGHITHGSIMVPYYPWRLSHSEHHKYHNHVDKDYSHPWYTEEKLKKPDENLARLMEDYPLVRAFFPIIGWALYLYGMPDGSHFIPFASQRMWQEHPEERGRCVLSTVVVLAYAALLLHLFNYDVAQVSYWYGAPALVYGWWLVAVTYLQHHNPDTLVYEEEDWKFVPAAFETVDRKFGWGIDTLHHHITDGHVAHHLFFTKIPHYNLPRATKAIVDYLGKVGLTKFYKKEITYDFPLRTHKYMVQFGFKAHLSKPLAAVADERNKKTK